MTRTDKKRVNALRPYYYGYGKDDVIKAYTPEEWGLGGSSAYSSNNPTVGQPAPVPANANFAMLSSFMASRRPTRIWPVSKAVSAPGRPLAAQ